MSCQSIGSTSYRLSEVVSGNFRFAHSRRDSHVHLRGHERSSKPAAISAGNMRSRENRGVAIKVHSENTFMLLKRA